MFYLYKSNSTGLSLRFEQVQPISLFGSKNGLIARALSTLLTPNVRQPCQWRLCARHIAEGLLGNEILIDADPSNKTEVKLYRLREVFGHSESEWTPMLWHCDALTNGATPYDLSRAAFVVSSRKIDGRIFTWTYARGTIVEGKLQGKWIPPGPSSTNGPLLWPHVMRYFISIASEILGPTVTTTQPIHISRLDCCRKV